MKQIPLKIVDAFVEGAKESKLDYKSFIKSILQFPVERNAGFTIDQIRSACKIIETLDKSKDFLVLEDSDYEYLKKIVQTTKYSIANSVMLTFVDDILNAKDVEAKPKP